MNDVEFDYGIKQAREIKPVDLRKFKVAARKRDLESRLAEQILFTYVIGKLKLPPKTVHKVIEHLNNPRDYSLLLGHVYDIAGDSELSANYFMLNEEEKDEWRSQRDSYSYT